MDDLQKRVLAEIREEELVTMAMDMVSIFSPPGAEAPAGDYLAGRLAELGMRVQLQEVEPGRNNVVGRLPGSKRSPTLLFSGHFDTSTTGREAEAWGSEYTADIVGGGVARATTADGWIHGLGASNMKGAFAAYWGALRALRGPALKLAGDVLVTGVVGETEKAAGGPVPGGGVPRRQGRLALSGHPRRHRGLRHHRGAHRHAPANRRDRLLLRQDNSLRQVPTHVVKEHGIDPIEKMMRVFAALQAWEPTYRERHPHPFMEARIGIGAIQGGHPYKPSKCPAPFCNLYVDVRVVPARALWRSNRRSRPCWTGSRPTTPSCAQRWTCT